MAKVLFQGGTGKSKTLGRIMKYIFFYIYIYYLSSLFKKSGIANLNLLRSAEVMTHGSFAVIINLGGGVLPFLKHDLICAG